jgi:hypothetical protein
VTDEEVVAVAFFVIEDEEVAEGVTLEGNYEVEEGKVVVDVRSLDSGDYAVVVTAGEEEADAVVTLDFKAVDAAVKAVNEATTQIKLAEALQNEYFVNDYVEANIVAYAELMGYDYSDATVAEVIEDIVKINESIATAGEFAAVKKALEEAYPNQLTIINILTENFDNVDADNIEAYETAIYGEEESGKAPVIAELDSLTKIQAAIDGVNDQVAATAVKTLIGKLPETDAITLEDKDDVVTARVAYDALTEEQQKLVDNIENLKTAETDIENLEAYEAAKAEVYALFVLNEDGEPKVVSETKELAEGVGSAEIEAAKELVTELKVKEYAGVNLVTLVTEANNLFANIAGRLAITSVSVVNKLRTDKVYVLGYWVEVNVNANESYLVEGEKGIVEDTESIVIQLYKGDTLLGEQTFENYGNVKESDKYTPEQAIVGGTIDVYGDYDSTSWNNVWYKGLTDIPDTAKAIVVYKDGRVVETEEDITGLDVTPFYVEALNRTETVEDMSRAIINLEEVKVETTFINLPKQAKSEVAKMVLDARNALETKKFPLATTELSAAYTAVTTANTNRNAFINGVNTAIADIATMRAALLGTEEAPSLIPEFADLSVADQTAAAELVLNALKAFEDGEKFETIAEIKAAAGL